MVLKVDEVTATASAAFTCHRFDVRMNRRDCFVERYEYRLTLHEGNRRIARKTITLPNDSIPTVIEINSI